MYKEDIENQYRVVEEFKSELQSMVKEFLKNKDNSLEDRWEVWTKYSQKNHEGCCVDFPEDRFPKLTDKANGCDGYFSRHEVIDYQCIVEIGKELNLDLNDLKEYLLEENLGSFEIDW